MEVCAVTLLQVFVGIIAFCNLLLLVAIAVLALSAKRFIDTSATPAVSDVRNTIQSVNSMVDQVEDKAERIMCISEETAQKLSDRVIATTDMVQESVTTPLINISSFVAGVTKAVETWRKASIRT
jgi:hypothetical protein